MTMAEIIDRVDRLRFNAFTREEKLAWLAQLEAAIRRELADTHEGAFPAGEGQTLPGFEGVYLRWLEAQIDLYSGELERYNAAIRLFNAEYAALESWVNRTFPPKGAGPFRW